MFSAKKGLILSFLVLMSVVFSSAQSRHSARATDEGGTILSVVATRKDGANKPIKTDNLYLYENGIEQKIKNFSYDPSPAKILILVDNSQTFRPDVEKLQKAIMEFAYEIFEGDQLYVIAYDEKPEIIQEWTDDAKKMEASLGLLRKKGNPYLFDALSVGVNEVLMPLMPGTRKTVIVLISDGLDRGSKMSFENTLSELQNNNVTLYALQMPDRTGGAFRRNQPKASQVITDLTEGTGGQIFPFEESQTAAKAICDELRKNRYLLSYSSQNLSSYDARRVFLIADEGISIRTKNAQPPNVKP
ncbi:MAG TPA: VWA domain-containing protein [Pyrinomonadaceae bacterium]|nr:VWA domain-containing protein [Pyrinomonadaceae bacterium]